MTADFLSDAERSEETRATASDDAFARLEKEMAAMKHAIGGLSDQIAEAASDIEAAAQLQASWIGDTFEDRVRERPLPTVALALGLGFLIGLTFRR